jgi:hypothetical protein
MLHKYLEGDVTKMELSNWAAFVFFSDFYIPEGETEEERLVAGEGPVWDIIQQLVTPELFEGLEIKVILGYLEMLEGN